MALECPLDRRSTLSFGRFVNTSNWRIWETDNPHFTLQVPLHSLKVPEWCAFFRVFILGPYFFEELGAGGPVPSITGQRYASLLWNKIIPDLQARQCLSRIICDESIRNFITNLLSRPF
ncbi:uncharacterized protein TNCV_4815821 [Trichonephila clavipes]|nr:uncharacterized protein TNCV_4815821 [Trichonephila clavipes]